MQRPIGEEYHNIQRKIDFMDAHSIDKSIVRCGALVGTPVVCERLVA